MPQSFFFLLVYCISLRANYDLFVLIWLSREGKDDAEQEANYKESKQLAKMVTSLNKVPVCQK